MTDERALLLSLRPRFAGALLDGTKTAELRRRRIAARPGALVILYASAPTMAIVGIGRLERTRVCDPEEAWREHSHQLGLLRPEFEAYLAGAKSACVLELHLVRRLSRPIPLASLRSSHGFDPPQSYRFVSASDSEALAALLKPA